MTRNDIAYPFRISARSSQASQASYQDHVEQMIEQVLLTSPGERVCLPEFGAGLRRLLFNNITSSLQASTQIVVVQALNRWLGDQINVLGVTVSAGDGSIAPEGAVVVEVDYELIETRAARQTQVQVI